MLEHGGVKIGAGDLGTITGKLTPDVLEPEDREPRFGCELVGDIVLRLSMDPLAVPERNINLPFIAILPLILKFRLK